MEKKEDCWFYQDVSIPENERKMLVLCINCHKKEPVKGWYWEGSRLGYGPYNFICEKCKHVIHKN